MKTVKIRRELGSQHIVQYFLNYSEQEIARYWEEMRAQCAANVCRALPQE